MVRDVDVLIKDFQQAEVDTVFYNKSWLSEWKSGTKNLEKYRFYLLTERGGTDNGKTQYWRCEQTSSDISPVRFRKQTTVNWHKKAVEKEEYPNPIEVKYSVGLIEETPVIVSVNPKYFW